MKRSTRPTRPPQNSLSSIVRGEISLVDGDRALWAPTSLALRLRRCALGRGRDRSAERDDVRSREGTERGDSRRGRWVVSATVTGSSSGVLPSGPRTIFSFFSFPFLHAFYREKKGRTTREKDRSIEPAAAAASVLLLALACASSPRCVRAFSPLLSLFLFFSSFSLSLSLPFSLFPCVCSVEQRGIESTHRGAADDGEGPDHGSLDRHPGDQEDSPWARNRDESEESADRERYYTSQHPNRWQDHLYVSSSGILGFFIVFRIGCFFFSFLTYSLVFIIVCASATIRVFSRNRVFFFPFSFFLFFFSLIL